MTQPFGDAYAAAYDWLYGSKDYAGECDLIERLLARHGAPGPRRLLDLGCGTGNHAFPLASRGHAVTGVDRAPAMLDHARAKLEQGPGQPQFLEGDLRSVIIPGTFDAVLMMFAVLGYQHDDTDLMAALATVRRHLAPGGLFLFDVWNGPAVLVDRPGPRQRSVDTPSGRLERWSDGSLDLARNLCRVSFHLRRLDGDRLVAETREEHVMRYFFPQELARVLAAADMDLVELVRFPDGQGAPDETAWTVIGVARALDGAERQS